MHVIGVPVQVCDTAVVLACVEHDEIHQVADLEVAPDAQVVVHFDLANGHPFKVSSYGVHFALVNRYNAIFDEAVFGVVELWGARAPGVVCYLVVIPYWDPGELLVREEKVEVGALGSETFAVVIESVDLAVWEGMRPMLLPQP